MAEIGGALSFTHFLLNPLGLGMSLEQAGSGEQVWNHQVTDLSGGPDCNTPHLPRPPFSALLSPETPPSLQCVFS